MKQDPKHALQKGDKFQFEGRTHIASTFFGSNGVEHDTFKKALEREPTQLIVIKDTKGGYFNCSSINLTT